tara:strand:+ start:503 stop:631 length:129 start_codon:yes stop_codon:yes gene_type:complete
MWQGAVDVSDSSTQAKEFQLPSLSQIIEPTCWKPGWQRALHM